MYVYIYIQKPYITAHVCNPYMGIINTAQKLRWVLTWFRSGAGLPARGRQKDDSREGRQGWHLDQNMRLWDTKCQTERSTAKKFLACLKSREYTEIAGRGRCWPFSRQKRSWVDSKRRPCLCKHSQVSKQMVLVIVSELESASKRLQLL